MNYISTIYDQTIYQKHQQNIENKCDCSCMNLTFNVNVASTPKSVQKRSSSKKLRKIGIEHEELKKCVECKKNKLMRRVLKKKEKIISEKMHNLTTSTKKISISFRKSFKKSTKRETDEHLNLYKQKSKKKANSMMKMNHLNNYCYYAYDALNKFNQLGQLQVWYV
jgi:hypothetical protein